jgi:hypothetical protein
MNHTPSETNWGTVLFAVFGLITIVLIALAVFDIWVQVYWVPMLVLTAFWLGVALFAYQLMDE